jgi:hypothetical protein
VVRKSYAKHDPTTDDVDDRSEELRKEWLDFSRDGAAAFPEKTEEDRWRCWVIQKLSGLQVLHELIADRFNAANKRRTLVIEQSLVLIPTDDFLAVLAEEGQEERRKLKAARKTKRKPGRPMKDPDA